ncbi:MAG: dihydrofolate reductase [Mitsuaria chitosanitabida]|jgi:dihydrofolate reductase|uniref:dihydrofolate reductase n=1 Tax=Roseateles chitosanitabidus TaxID=65048 RepID=UPI001B256AE1|nr:dihydrofolate reductase [Roseateles chitosanitabidus]MBO9688220.1 dihydrofolate reductase [Roseateles chitosanitabidus]
MPHLTLIAALDRARGIGRDNELLVRLPEDMARFKALTMGHTVIMGRKTWDSIPARFRPLVQRRNLVLSRQAGLTLDGAEVFPTLDAALAACGADEAVFVMGGAQIYAETLPRADALELTELDQTFPADAFFPPVDTTVFAEVTRERHHSPADRGHGWDYAFVRYERR